MTKNQIILEHIVVTFFEAGVAYLTINQTNLSGDWKGVAIGAVGAGLAAVYNVLRQSKPTIPAPIDSQIIGLANSPITPMNGVPQLTQSEDEPVPPTA